jgi:predicted nucleic acid-binding protein
MSGVLVDSSAWIDFFRGFEAAGSLIDPLLADDRASTTAIIAAEVTSGARTRAAFEELTTRLGALPILPEPANLWRRVAELRFTLARQGFQAHLVDLAIALSAVEAGHRLLTRDRDFLAIAKVIALDLQVF